MVGKGSRGGFPPDFSGNAQTATRPNKTQVCVEPYSFFFHRYYPISSIAVLPEMQEVDRPEMNGSMNLTPTSDGTTGNNAAPSLPSLRVSSTQASVDSESDYQMTTSSAMTATASSASTSRPLSRSSSIVSGTSALSTTATKDGVEGKKVRRFHDPLGYTAWLKSTNNARLFDDDNASGAPSGAPSGIASGIASGDGSGDTTPSVNSGDSDGHKTPPNIPSAPPVTLNEKMRLLRTGSVSGHGHGPQESSSSQSDNSASA
uniref:ARAD1D18788p n=1 Tax=Blastobotrys adeninivorans TaxID=409370 RepID=A0A060T9J9_BLAAD